MQIHLTLVAAPGYPADGGEPADTPSPQELVINCAPDGVGLLVEELARRWGPGVFTVDGRPLQDLHPGTPPLVSGAVIVAAAGSAPGRPGEAGRGRGGRGRVGNGTVGSERSGSGRSGSGRSGSGQAGTPPGFPPLLLSVEEGPDCGQLWPLVRGRYVLGRRPPGRAAGRLELGDPSLSRLHSEIVVGTDSVSVHDLRPEGGRSRRSRARRAVLLEAGGTLRAGESVLRLHVGAETAGPLPQGPAGALPEPEQVPIRVPNPGSGPRAMVLVGALLALVAGLVLAAVMGSWLFLVFSGLSALTAGAGAVQAKVKRRRTAALLRAAAEQDRQRRQAAWPGPGVLVLRVLAAATAAAAGRDLPAENPVLRNAAPSPADTDPARAAPTRATPVRATPPHEPFRAAAGAGPQASLGSPGPASSRAASGQGVQVRIGRAEQPARVVLDPAPDRQPSLPLHDAPRLHTLAPGGRTRVSGSPDKVAALLRSLLVQLAARPVPVQVAAVGLPAELAAAARFLPGVRLLPEASPPARAATVQASTAQAATARAPGVQASTAQAAWDAAPASCEQPMILVLGPDAACEPQGVAAGQVPGGLSVLDCRTGPGRGEIHLGADSCLHEAGPDSGDGTSGAAGQPLPLLPDGLGAGPFERVCRALPQLAGPAVRPPGLPDRLPLADLHPQDPTSIQRIWQRSGAARGAGLPVPLGLGAAGVVELDLVRDGPHLLVAGTTGAGKSDLLRALLTGLAARHSPAEVNFLLIDFKGGAGLGPLAALPHAAGLLTSLSAGQAARTLASLNAELRRREALFAAAGRADLPGFNAAAGPGRSLPRLVVAVDEFRVLSEEVPGALAELMRIAAVGRSLGLHLVLATQRPQGAISADIRANVSAAVCLRVQSEAESRDVLGVPAAAALPAAVPGRGYLRTAAEQPVVFQAAGFDLPPSPGAAVSTLGEHLSGRLSAPPAGGPVESRPAGISDASASGLQLVTAAAVAADRLGLAPARRPVADPLPERLDFQSAQPQEPLPLGLLDLPQLQARAILSWHPERDGHLALLGLPGSGVDEASAALLAAHLQAFPGRHVYLLDGDGSLAAYAGAPQVGACVRPDDPGRAVRVLRRLGAAARGAADAADAGATLLVSGWGGWVSALRSVRGADGEELLADLARGTRPARPAVVVSGGRELSAARFFGFLPNRFFLPAGAGPETMLTWPAMPGTDPLPGRAHCVGPAVQRAVRPLLAGFPGAGSTPGNRRRAGMPEAEGAAAQLALAPAGPGTTVPLPAGAAPPARVEPLPRLLDAACLPPARLNEAGALVLPLGVCGDELGAAQTELASGSVFLVLGRAGSGRTGLLRLIRAAAAPLVACFDAACGSELAEAVRRVQEGEQALILADDVERYEGAQQQQLVSAAAAGARLVLAAAPGPGLPGKVPAAAALRSRPLGALLAGTGPVEQDLFGFRPDSAIDQLPGRGWLVAAAAAEQVQFARLQPDIPAGRAAGHSAVKEAFREA